MGSYIALCTTLYYTALYTTLYYTALYNTALYTLYTLSLQATAARLKAAVSGVASGVVNGAKQAASKLGLSKLVGPGAGAVAVAASAT